MSFANLFTTLSAVDDARSSCQAAFHHRNETGNGRRGRGRKRKDQGEHTGSYGKKHCYSTRAAGTYNTRRGSTAEDCQRHKTNSEYTSTGFNKQANQDQSKNYRYANKQQQQSKMRGKQRNLHQQTDRWNENHQTRPTARKGGRGRKSENTKQDFPQKRFMSQEFKEQNALEVDGRFICQHFVYGRCIKGDQCQLEHVQLYNGLIKDVCKFYIQGFCMKGESCPYMHKSFPCKFFHRSGKCTREDCKFSHEPLNDVTEKLLDEIIKRAKDLKELVKKTEESAGEPENTQVSERTEANTTADFFTQPGRPNFYNSSDTNTEKETGQSEEQVDVTEEVAPPHAGDDAQPHNSTSVNKYPKEPVCYSVEAVLGPQLSKPFSALYSTPGSQEPSPSSANQSEAPYSVCAVLRSYKSADSGSFSTFSTSPVTQTVSYTPKTELEEVCDPRSENKTDNVSHLANSKYEPNKCQEKPFKSLSSLQINTNKCPDLMMTCSDNEQCGEVAESLKPAQSEAKSQLHGSASSETRGGIKEGSVSKVCSALGHRKEKRHRSMDVTCPENCKSEALPPVGSTHSGLYAQTSAPKPHLSQSSSFIKPFCPSSVFREFKGTAAVSSKTTDSETALSNDLTAKQPTEIHQHSNLSARQHRSAEATAECSHKMVHCGDFRSSEIPARPFHNLFASPITDTLQPVATSSGPRGFDQSVFPTPSSADSKPKDNHLKNEPHKTFLSLFAAPLRHSTAPLPHVQSQSDYSRTSSCFQESNQPAESTSHLSDSKLRSPVQLLPGRTAAKISDLPTSPNPKKKNEDGPVELVVQPKRQLVNSACSLTSDSCSETSTNPVPGLSRSQAHQQRADISSHKTASAGSVLRSLFLHLRPYQQDGAQQDHVPPECKKMNKSRTGCVFEEQRQKSKRKKKSKNPADADPAEQQSSLQTAQMNHSLKPVKQPPIADTGPTLKPCSEEKCTTEITPLKDLFKTLQPL